MIEQLKEQIKVVAEARRDTKNAKDAVSVARIDWEVENDSIIKTAETFCEELLIDEAKLRELTLEAYAETGDKTPAEGVGIREVTKLDYDQKVALDWAKSHKLALGLNKRAFEKIVKASDSLDFTFVKVSHEPQATIATNLNEIREEKK